VAGLEYLHEYDIIHGDLKGVSPWTCRKVETDIDDRYQANILIDSECCARLADFGLVVINDETTTKSAVGSRGTKGTTRYMAPELMLPEEFGFTGKFLKHLPSTSTDIYAIGMTILEVSVCSCPQKY
jgi:serine/threonine protein kinase